MNAKETILSPLAETWSTIAGFLPNLLAGIAILIVGYFVARLLGAAVAAIARRLGLDEAGDSVGMGTLLENAGIGKRLSMLLGDTVFVLTMLVFAISAADSFGLRALSGTIDTFVLYVPKIIVAVLITIGGLIVAQLLRDIVQRSCRGLGTSNARTLSGAAYAAAVLVVATFAIAQLEIDTALLQMVIGIALVMAGIATAISLGLGTRAVSRDIVAGIYTRETFPPGTRLKIGSHEGTVVVISAIGTVIATDDGRHVHLANHVLADSVVEAQPAPPPPPRARAKKKAG